VCPGVGSLEVIDLKSHKEGEHTIDDELSEKTERMGLGSTVSAPSSTAQAAAPAAAAGDKKTRPCSTCGGDFSSDMQAYREHFRTGWHRFNLKRKAKKLPIVSEGEFNELDPEEISSFFALLT
jgi:hypothetical protein